MPKSLVILGVFLAFSPLSRASHIRSSSVALYIWPDSSSVDTNSCPDDTKTEETYWRNICKPDVLPVWIGGAAALIASIVGVNTLGKIKEQTEAAVVAANAAKKSVDAQINIERPWLLIEALKVPQYTRISASDPIKLEGTFFYKIRNYGKTPARVCALKMRLEIGKSADHPPSPSEVFDSPDFAVNPHIIPPGKKRPASEKVHPNQSFTNIEDREITDSRVFLWAYGLVRYLDVHGGYYETRICFRYNPTTEELQLDGPPEYNNAT